MTDARPGAQEPVDTSRQAGRVASAAAAAALAGFLSSPLQAHDVFPPGLIDPDSKFHCCHAQGPMRDCEQVKVQEVSRAYFFIHSTGERFPKWRIHWESRDGHWYRCWFKDTVGPLVGKTKCLIGPMPSG